MMFKHNLSSRISLSPSRVDEERLASNLLSQLQIKNTFYLFAFKLKYFHNLQTFAILGLLVRDIKSTMDKINGSEYYSKALK